MSKKKTAGRKVSGMTKILATAVVMTMVMMMSKNAFAVSDVGTVLGHQCYASLGIGQVYGTGETSCDQSSASCTVTVTIWYTYPSGGGTAVGGNTQTGVGSGSAYANAYGASNGYVYHAKSSHNVTFSGRQWTTNLELYN